MKKTTVKEIAKALNVSVATVYRALNNTGYVKASTKEQILKKAEELNYRPNLIARKFAMSSKFRILIIMPIHPSFYWNDVRLGVSMAEQELSEFGVEILVESIDNQIFNTIPVEEVIKIVEKSKPNGLLVTHGRIQEFSKLLSYAKEKKIATAIYNDGQEYQDRIFYYGPNKEIAGRVAGELTGKFIRGKGIVCVLARTYYLSAYTQRIMGFVSYLNEYSPEIVLSNIYTYKEGNDEAVLDNILKNYPDVNALYIMDAAGAGIFGQYLKERGIKDIVVVGHESSPLSRQMLMEGYVTALICDKKVCQGYYPVKLLYDYLSTGVLPEKRDLCTDINVVLRENSLYLEDYRYGCGFQ
ncbi:MAG TPA: substrate-binding domain-containing protein [Clostridiaceae bacterium]|nr:substrate-binding domain-containing protein [Clostridiaceae bacterium]